MSEMKSLGKKVRISVLELDYEHWRECLPSLVAASGLGVE